MPSVLALLIGIVKLPDSIFSGVAVKGRFAVHKQLERTCAECWLNGQFTVASSLSSSHHSSYTRPLSAPHALIPKGDNHTHTHHLSISLSPSL